jgi:hypothetical protein
MVWLFTPPQGNEKEREEILEESNESIRIPVGSYYYWIRVEGEVAELCRITENLKSHISYEVLHHALLGITDDDIEEAICQANGELTVNKEYPISGHIKTRLQSLYEPA